MVHHNRHNNELLPVVMSWWRVVVCCGVMVVSAADVTYNEKNAGRPDGEIDLHGLTVAEVGQDSGSSTPIACKLHVCQQ